MTGRPPKTKTKTKTKSGPNSWIGPSTSIRSIRSESHQDRFNLHVLDVRQFSLLNNRALDTTRRVCRIWILRCCVYRKQLDLETLVCTRGPNFPIYGWSRGLWIPVLTSAVIFARRVLAMMSFSIFSARL